MTTDYKATLFLPQTDFPMRGGLPKLEPKLLEYWDRINLFERQRAVAKGREKFILHDGPPYANGNIHIGHALNKILKDQRQDVLKSFVAAPGPVKSALYARLIDLNYYPRIALHISVSVVPNL